MDHESMNLSTVNMVDPAYISDKVKRARSYRENLGIGLYEAKRMVEREDLEQEIESIESMDDVKTFLRNLMKYVR